jgi:hypothetical protein
MKGLPAWWCVTGLQYRWVEIPVPGSSDPWDTTQQLCDLAGGQGVAEQWDLEVGASTPGRPSCCVRKDPGTAGTQPELVSVWQCQWKYWREVGSMHGVSSEDWGPPQGKHPCFYLNGKKYSGSININQSVPHTDVAPCQRKTNHVSGLKCLHFTLGTELIHMKHLDPISSRVLLRFLNGPNCKNWLLSAHGVQRGKWQSQSRWVVEKRVWN